MIINHFLRTKYNGQKLFLVPVYIIYYIMVLGGEEGGKNDDDNNAEKTTPTQWFVKL